MKEDPPPDARCRDKFLVQSVAISAENDTPNVTQVWANIEQTAKSSIQEKKIRVNFLPADGQATPAVGGLAATNGIAHHGDEPPAYDSPSPVAVTPQRPIAASASHEKSPAYDNAHSEIGQPQSTLGAAGAAISNATGISQDDLRRQLDEAKATISRLQNQASEGLRQRKTGGETTTAQKSSPGIQNAPPAGGVPVQIVAGLCLLCFLIAYLFF